MGFGVSEGNIMRIQVVKDLELVVRPGSYAVKIAPHARKEALTFATKTAHARQ